MEFQSRHQERGWNQLNQFLTEKASDISALETQDSPTRKHEFSKKVTQSAGTTIMRD